MIWDEFVHKVTSRTKQDFDDWHKGPILRVMGYFGTSDLELKVSRMTSECASLTEPCG